MKSLLGRSSKKTQPSVDLGPGKSPLAVDTGRPPQQQSPAAFLEDPSLTGYRRQPSRTQSHRQSATGTPPIDRLNVGSSSTVYGQANLSEDKLSDHRLSSVNPHGSSDTYFQEKEHKRGFREKFGLGHSSKHSVDQQPSGRSSRADIGRTPSLRGKKDTLGIDQYQKQPGEIRGPSWSTSGSNPHLISHLEEDENNLQNLRHSNHPAYIDPSSSSEALSSHEHYYTQGQNHLALQQDHPYSQAPQNYYKQPALQRLDTERSTHFEPQRDQDHPFSPAHPHSAYAQEGAYIYNVQQEQHQYQEYPLHTGQVASPLLQRHPVGIALSHPYSLQPQEREHSRSRQSSSQFDGSSIHGSTASFEQHPPQYSAQAELVHLQSSKGQAEQITPGQDPLFLHPPSAAGASIQSPPSPLQVGLKDPLGSGTHQPPSPEEATILPNMPRESQARSGNPARISDSRGLGVPGSRESQGFTQTGTAPPTPGFANVQQAHAVRMQQGKGEDKGRETPLQNRELTDEDAAHYFQLQKDHTELRDKYQKVKKYYFEKEAQVHQLQNTLAHQRLSQSRTSLDDSEYTARFGRLEGLMAQLAFGVRKSWQSVPEFLQRGVNKDAIATGKQEMTAVGRAFICHWLVTEVFDEYFHPDLDLELNLQLKQIYESIRQACPPFQSKEEEEALNGKLISWRMTTLEGLQAQLHSAEAPANRQALVERLNAKLIADISEYLQEPTPAELTTGVPMIIELAVNVASHLPMESRDVVIEYPYPGDTILPNTMKVETGIPALTNPIIPSDGSMDSERASLRSAGNDKASDNNALADEGTKDSKKGVFAKAGKALAGGAAITGQGAGAGIVPQNTGASISQSGGGGAGSGNTTTSSVSASGAQKDDTRVRFASGISVQVRGRSVLQKAPVYTT